MRRIVMSVAVVAVGASGGCQTTHPLGGTATGASGFSYRAGTASQVFAEPAPRVRDAAREAMADLGMRPIRQGSTPEGGLVLEGTSADGRTASVTIAPRDAIASALTVRIGWFGDQALSRALTDRVGIHLATPTPACPSDEPPASSPSRPILSRAGGPDPELLRRQADLGYRDTPVP